eukprot:s402_g4.t1
MFYSDEARCECFASACYRLFPMQSKGACLWQELGFGMTLFCAGCTKPTQCQSRACESFHLTPADPSSNGPYPAKDAQTCPASWAV